MRCHAGELTNKPDCEFWIRADHALETMSRYHEEGYMLHGDSGDRVGSIPEQGHLTQQVALDESVQDPLLSIDPAPRLDRTLMDQVRLAVRFIALLEITSPGSNLFVGMSSICSATGHLRENDASTIKVVAETASGSPSGLELPERIGGPSRTRTLDPLIKSRDEELRTDTHAEPFRDDNEARS
jgi:hypothetical protein